MLVELALNGKVCLDDGKKLLVLDSDPIGDEILDVELGKILKSGRPKKITSWVNALGQKTLRRQIGASLVTKGVIVKAGIQFRWVIPSSIFPQQNASAKYWIKQRLRGIILASETAEPRLIALLNLLHACRLLNLVFTKDERRAASRQVEKLVKVNFFGEPLAQYLAEIELAVREFALTASTNS